MVKTESSSLQTGVIPKSFLEVKRQQAAIFEGFTLWKFTIRFEIHTRIRVNLFTFLTFLLIPFIFKDSIGIAVQDSAPDSDFNSAKKLSSEKTTPKFKYDSLKSYGIISFICQLKRINNYRSNSQILKFGIGTIGSAPS